VNTDSPAVFATQSTHKVLAALSQASMIHVKEGSSAVDYDRFNEAYMMHMSTSPQYTIVASLDVAARMMEGSFGKALIDETMEEAILFRQKMVLIGEEMGAKTGTFRDPWWFSVWQPPHVIDEEPRDSRKESRSDEDLRNNAHYWTLDPCESWHGFPAMSRDYAMLDPIKVTILTPGIDSTGLPASAGIPACIVTAYLRKRGIVVEKTGHYSFLILFTIGITKGKSGTLLAELFEFKRLYDDNAPLGEMFPEVAEKYPRHHGIRDFCQAMHQTLVDARITSLVEDLCTRLPGQALLPADAYRHLVRGEVEKVAVERLAGRIAAVTIVPYPPGIPVVMPGERFTAETGALIEYLEFCQDFDRLFPGFETEIHGVERVMVEGSPQYELYCVK
jgi:lysine decarboxylase/arginine decarboxylase